MALKASGAVQAARHVTTACRQPWSPIPGAAGGCLVGGGRTTHIYHFTADGLLVGTLKPGAAMCTL